MKSYNPMAADKLCHM